jgi:plasmid stability protein
MGQVLVRGLEDDVIDRLKTRAEENNRSLEAELREILVQASRQVSMARFRALADEIRRQLGDQIHSDSAELIREDRDR